MPSIPLNSFARMRGMKRRFKTLFGRQSCFEVCTLRRIEPLDEAGSETLQEKLTSLAAKDGAGMNQSSVLHAFTMLTLNIAGDVLKAADLDAGTTHA